MSCPTNELIVAGAPHFLRAARSKIAHSFFTEVMKMLKRAGLMAAGIVIGLVVTGILLEQERRETSGASGDQEEKKNGRFAEISGNTVRMYEVKDGHFCGYSETKVFESNEEAMDWVVKETDAKIIIKGEDA